MHRLLLSWQELRDFMHSAMSCIYARSIIDEWTGSHIDVHVRKVDEVRKRIIKAIGPIAVPEYP